MSKLERAKAFVANNLKRSALIIVPLAAVAIQCQASVTFTMGEGGIATSGSGSPSTVINNPFTDVQLLNGVNGISLAGKGTFTATASGSGNSGSTCGSMCAGFFTLGSVSGSFDSDSLLVTYLINLSDNNNSPIDWVFSIAVANHFATATGTTDPGGGTLDGSILVTGLSGASLPDFWNANFTTDFHNSFNTGDTITVDVPSGTTVDIGAVSATPEPGTAGLMAIAGAALIGLRKRLLRR